MTPLALSDPHPTHRRDPRNHRSVGLRDRRLRRRRLGRYVGSPELGGRENYGLTDTHAFVVALVVALAHEVHGHEVHGHEVEVAHSVGLNVDIEATDPEAVHFFP